MTTSEFKGLRFGGGTLLGLLDGVARLVIPRAGENLVTTDADGVNTLHTSVLNDTSKIAFDSAWSGAATILAQGVATPSTTNRITVGAWSFGVLATWPDPGYVPVPLIFDQGGIFGPSWDGQWVFDNQPTIDTYEAYSNVIHTAVTRSSVGVVQRNLYNGTVIPNRAMQYIILGVSAI